MVDIHILDTTISGTAEEKVQCNSDPGDSSVFY